jgi:hypothetical protein
MQCCAKSVANAELHYSTYKLGKVIHEDSHAKDGLIGSNMSLLG